MAINKTPTHFVTDIADDYPQVEIPNDQRLVPLQPEAEPIQVAGGWVGRWGSRLVGRVDDVLPNAYDRYADKIEKQKSLEETLGEATEEYVTPAGQTRTRLNVADRFEVRKVVMPRPAFGTKGKSVPTTWEVWDSVGDAGEPALLGTFAKKKDASAFLTRHQGRVEEAPPVEAPPVAERDIDYTGPLVDEMDRNDGYKSWLTVGDPELDKMLEARTAQYDMQDGMIAGIRVQSRVNLRVDENVPPGTEVKVPDEAHIYQTLDATGDAIEKTLNKLGKEELDVITLEQTEAMANILGTRPDALARTFLRGQFNLGPNSPPGELAAKMIAGKNMLITEIRKLDEIADRWAVGRSDEIRYEWKQQATLVANLQRSFRGAQTDIARALSAMRVGVAGDAELIARDYAKIVDDAGGADQLDHAIEAYRASDDLAQRANLVRTTTRAQKFFNGVHEMWINSLLSGWFTHLKNTAGVTAAIVLDTTELAVTAARQAPYGLVGRERDVTFGDVQAHLFGQLMSIREATNASARAFWLREDALQGAEMTLIAGNNRLRGADAISAEAMELGGWKGDAVNGLGQLVTMGRAPTRALMAEDAFMKVVSYRGALWEMAFRQGRQLGKKGEELSEYMADFVMNPTKEMAERAKEKAKYVTLQTDLEGRLKKLQEALSGTGRWLVPFYKTPTNAILYVGERSIFAPVMKRYKDAIQEGGVAAAQARTRMGVGQLIMLGFAMEYKAGNITGGISSDSDIRKNYERQGIKPYHIKIGDTWYNYGVVEPLSTLIGLFVDIIETAEHPQLDERTSAEIMTAAAGAIGYNMTNKSFMAGPAMFMDAARNPGRYSEKMIRNYMKSLVPGSAAWNELKRATDELQRLRIDMDDHVRARLPGFSLTMEPERDLWGRKIVHTRVASPYNPNVVDQELAYLDKGQKSATLSGHPTNLDGDIGLEAEEIGWFHERAGTMAFQVLEYVVNPDSKTDPSDLPTTPEGDPLVSAGWSEVKEAYRKMIGASREGNRLAHQSARQLVQKLMLAVRSLAAYQLKTDSPYADELTRIRDSIDAEKEALGLEALQLIEAQ